MFTKAIVLCAAIVFTTDATAFNFTQCTEAVIDYANQTLPPLRDMTICQWNLPMVGLLNHERPTVQEVRPVRVVMLDSGVDPLHNEIKHALNEELSCSWVRVLNPKKVDGHKAVNDPNRPICGKHAMKGHIHDYEGHGTLTASIITGRIDGRGIDGVAPTVDLVVYKITQFRKAAYFDDILHAIRRAADIGADIINVSYGHFNPICRDGEVPDDENYRTVYQNGGDLTDAIDAAIAYAHSKGALVIVGASENRPARDATANPDCFDTWSSSDAVVVTAHGPNGAPFSYSNSGNDITITAPGGDATMAPIISPFAYRLYIEAAESPDTQSEEASAAKNPRFQLGGVLGAYPNYLNHHYLYPDHSRYSFILIANEKYGWRTGTSFAAPMAAGIAALIKQQYLHIDAAALKEKLIDSSVYRGCDTEVDGTIHTIDIGGDQQDNVKYSKARAFNRGSVECRATMTENGEWNNFHGFGCPTLTAEVLK